MARRVKNESQQDRKRIMRMSARIAVQKKIMWNFLERVFMAERERKA